MTFPHARIENVTRKIVDVKRNAHLDVLSRDGAVIHSAGHCSQYVPRGLDQNMVAQKKRLETSSYVRDLMMTERSNFRETR